MSESIYKNNELENEVSLDMSYFWYSDVGLPISTIYRLHPFTCVQKIYIIREISVNRFLLTFPFTLREIVREKLREIPLLFLSWLRAPSQTETIFPWAASLKYKPTDQNNKLKPKMYSLQTINTSCLFTDGALTLSASRVFM